MFPAPPSPHYNPESLPHVAHSNSVFWGISINISPCEPRFWVLVWPREEALIILDIFNGIAESLAEGRADTWQREVQMSGSQNFGRGRVVGSHAYRIGDICGHVLIDAM